MKNPQSFSQGKTALITGASSGIGYELAGLFAAEGYSLILIARGGEKLKGIAGDFEGRFPVSVKVIPKDLSQPSAAEEIFQELESQSILRREFSGDHAHACGKAQVGAEKAQKVKTPEPFDSGDLGSR